MDTSKIKVFDNVLNLLDVKTLRKQILFTPMTWNGADKKETPVNTLTKELAFEDNLTQKFHKIATNVIPQLESHNFYRCGINLTMPQFDPPYFHTDGDNVISCVFYLNPITDTDEGGETQFEIDDAIYGVKSKPGRLTIFDGSILHRMTYFRKEIRIIIFLKYYKNLKYNLFEM